MLIGQYLFYAGIFLLPSAMFISGILILLSIIIAITKKKDLFFRDKFNLPLVILSFLIFFSCFHNQIVLFNKDINYWVGTLNWVPFFISFFFFQFYVDTFKKRQIFSVLILIGSIPFFFSCIMQYWFQWYGPYDLLNGLIVWFQKPPIGDASLSLSGLFSNSNYAGQWLSIIFPFSLIFIFKRNRSFLIKIISIFLCILIFYLVNLTDSRNAFLGLILSIPVIFTFKGFLILFCFFFLLYIFFAFNFLQIVPNNLKELITLFISEELIEKFKVVFIENTRITIWKNVFLKIINKPFFGWGAGSFSLILLVGKSEFIINHAHNLPLELAYNFGIPFSFIISLFFIFILIKAAIVIYKNKTNCFENLLDRAWLASTLIILFTHLSDVTYYDGRISLTLWILIAGLKKIIDKNNSYEIKKSINF